MPVVRSSSESQREHTVSRADRSLTGAAGLAALWAGPEPGHGGVVVLAVSAQAAPFVRAVAVRFRVMARPRVPGSSLGDFRTVVSVEPPA